MIISMICFLWQIFFYFSWFIYLLHLPLLITFVHVGIAIVVVIYQLQANFQTSMILCSRLVMDHKFMWPQKGLNSKPTNFRLPRRPEDVLQIRLENVFKMSCEMSWRRLEDIFEINKMFTKISVLIHGLLRNLNQYLTNLYLKNLCFTNLRRILNALIKPNEPNNFYICLTLKLNQQNYFKIDITEQLRH